MNKVKKSKVLIPVSLIVTLIILAVSLSISVFASSKQDKVNGINNQISNLDQQIKESQKKINEINEQKKKSKDSLGLLMDEVNEIQKQIDIFDKKIDVLNASIKDLNTKIQISETQIQLQQDNIEKSKSVLSDRLRAMYISGQSSSIEILMSSDNFESFLTRVELVQRVSKHDKKLIDDLQSQIDKLKKDQKVLNDRKAEIEANKKQLADAKNEIMPKKRLLDYKADKVDSEINSLSSQGKLQKNIQGRLMDQKAAFAAEVDRILDGNISTGSGTGVLGWPYPHSGCYISSPFGYRTHPVSGKRKLHTGIDISRNGARYLQDKAVSAADGVVVYRGYDANGYGNYITIDHGNGLSTRYAHMHRVYVNLHQRVSKGQVVGIVGSTGCSTGAHLHFEVRVNNKPVQPLNYVSKP